MKPVSSGMLSSGCASSMSRSSVVPDRPTPTTIGMGGRASMAATVATWGRVGT